MQTPLVLPFRPPVHKPLDLRLGKGGRDKLGNLHLPDSQMTATGSTFTLVAAVPMQIGVNGLNGGIAAGRFKTLFPHLHHHVIQLCLRR